MKKRIVLVVLVGCLLGTVWLLVVVQDETESFSTQEEVASAEKSGAGKSLALQAKPTSARVVDPEEQTQTGGGEIWQDIEAMVLAPMDVKFWNKLELVGFMTEFTELILREHDTGAAVLSDMDLKHYEANRTLLCSGYVRQIRQIPDTSEFQNRKTIAQDHFIRSCGQVGVEMSDVQEALALGELAATTNEDEEWKRQNRAEGFSSTILESELKASELTSKQRSLVEAYLLAAISGPASALWQLDETAKFIRFFDDDPVKQLAGLIFFADNGAAYSDLFAKPLADGHFEYQIYLDSLQVQRVDLEQKLSAREVVEAYEYRSSNLPLPYAERDFGHETFLDDEFAIEDD